MSTGDCTRIHVAQDDPPGCDSDLDCPVGQVCRNGECVDSTGGGGGGGGRSLSKGALLAIAAALAYVYYKR